MTLEPNDDHSHYTVSAEEWNASDEEFAVDLYAYGKESIHLEDYECLAATGTIYVLEVSPEATRWLLAPPDKAGWFDLYVGDVYIGSSDGLKALYEKLNP